MRSAARVAAALLVLVAALGAGNLLRPVPAVEASIGFPRQSIQGTPPVVPWPEGGQAAIGAEGAGVLAASPGARPVPIYSVAKVMTALVVLEAKPLQRDERGPVIAITDQDVGVFRQLRADKQSVLEVAAGEQLTEYEALQGLLIPSGNNVAVLLGRWAFGSPEAEVARMNARAAELGLTQTHFADASGADEQTTSVPADLVVLGAAAMREPVFAAIAGQPEARLPVAGLVYNVNAALGQDGITGVKTGSSNQGGAAYLFAAPDRLADGRQVLVLGAVTGLATLDGAFQSARTLLATLRGNLGVRRVVTRDQAVAAYRPPWGGFADVVAAADLDVLLWPGTAVRSRLVAPAVRPPLSPRRLVGSLEVRAGDQVHRVPLATADQLYGPGRLWRLTRLR